MKRKIFLSTLIILAFLVGCGDKQDAEFLNISEETLSFLGEDGDGGSFMVLSNTQWTVTANESWLKSSPSFGEGDGGVAVSAEYNSAEGIRTGSVTVSTLNGLRKSVIITQLGTAPAIIAGPPTLVPMSGGGLMLVRVTATHEWEAVIPAEAQDWITLVGAETTALKGWAVFEFDLNETDVEREANITFRLKNEITVSALVSVAQPFIIEPDEIEFPPNFVTGMEVSITGNNMGSIQKVFVDDVELAIIDLTDEWVTVSIPTTAAVGTFELKIIYGTKEMELGPVNIIPPFPNVGELPEEAVIGAAFILHGSLLNSVTRVFLGSLEVDFVFGITPGNSMLVTVPATANPGVVDIKFIFGVDDDEEIPGKVELIRNDEFEADKDLARWAGSRYDEVDPNVPRVVEGGRTNGFNVGNGRAVIYAFDGVVTQARYDLMISEGYYQDYYVGQTNWNGTSFGSTVLGGIPNSAAQTFWQCNSGQNQGEIGDAPVPTNRACFWLDYTFTEQGYVVFDKLEIIGRGNNADATQEFTVEISDNAQNWIKVIRAEQTEEFVGGTTYTYNLPTPVKAKYVRYVIVKSLAGNTGLRKFELFRTK